jgi:hypothetical protein
MHEDEQHGGQRQLEGCGCTFRLAARGTLAWPGRHGPGSCSIRGLCMVADTDVLCCLQHECHKIVMALPALIMPCCFRCLSSPCKDILNNTSPESGAHLIDIHCIRYLGGYVVNTCLMRASTVRVQVSVVSRPSRTDSPSTACSTLPGTLVGSAP